MKQKFMFECLRGHRSEWSLEAGDDGTPIYEVMHGHEVKPMCLTCHLSNRSPNGVNIESESMAPLEPEQQTLTEQQRATLRGEGENQTKWVHP